MGARPPRGIYRRGNRYWCRVRIGGELRRRPAGRTLAEAKRVLASMRAEQNLARARAGQSSGARSNGAAADSSAQARAGRTGEPREDVVYSGGAGEPEHARLLAHLPLERRTLAEPAEPDEPTKWLEQVRRRRRPKPLRQPVHIGHREHGPRLERSEWAEHTRRFDPAEHTRRLEQAEHTRWFERAVGGSDVSQCEKHRDTRGDGAARRPLDAGPPGLRIRDLYRVWADAPRSEPLRPTTMKNTRLALARFAAWAGEGRGADEITEKMVQAYANERRKQVSAVSVQSELRPLSAALNAAVEAGYLEHRPRIKLAKAKRRRPTFLEKEEVQALLEMAPDEGANAELAIRIALGAGLRHQEILHLRRCDCRLGEHPSLVVAAWGGWAPKSGVDREVPISQELAERIRARLRHLPDQGRTAPLFQHADGRRVCSVARSVAAAFKCAGLYREESRPGLHCLRRTWATHLLRTGADLETVRVLGGWADLKTPMHYLGSSARHQRAAIARLPW